MNTFRQTAKVAGLIPAQTFEEYLDEPLELIELDRAVTLGTPEQRELVRVAIELALSDVEQLLMHDSFIAGANGNAQGLAAAAGRVRSMSATNSLTKGSKYVESLIDSAIERAANPLGGGR